MSERQCELQFSHESCTMAQCANVSLLCQHKVYSEERLQKLPFDCGAELVRTPNRAHIRWPLALLLQRAVEKCCEGSESLSGSQALPSVARGSRLEAPQAAKSVRLSDSVPGNVGTGVNVSHWGSMWADLQVMARSRPGLQSVDSGARLSTNVCMLLDSLTNTLASIRLAGNPQNCRHCNTLRAPIRLFACSASNSPRCNPAASTSPAVRRRRPASFIGRCELTRFRAIDSLAHTY